MQRVTHIKKKTLCFYTFYTNCKYGTMATQYYYSVLEKLYVTTMQI
jgi:hypothetical protein